MKKFGDYIKVGEAAELLGVSPWTLRYWDRTGKLKPARHPLSRYRLYRREQLDELLRLASEESFQAANADLNARPPDGPQKPPVPRVTRQ